MATLEVKCTVSDCFFHKKENLCGAEKIEINMNHQATMGGSTEFASDFDFQSRAEKVKHSTDTCCNTFIRKEEKTDH